MTNDKGQMTVLCCLNIHYQRTMERIDINPTHTYGDFKLRRGKPFPFGATLVPGGVNFSIFSSHAKSCSLVLFKKLQSRQILFFSAV